MAVALKRENPARTAAQVRRILRAQMGWAPGERTLQRHFADDPQIAAISVRSRRRGPARGGVRAVRGRPAQRAVDRRRPARPARSAAARPTCSRSSTTTPGRSWGTGSGSPRTPCGWPRRCARRSARAGSPTGSTSTTARRSSTPGCCGPARSSGIRLIHSTPGRPQGRGKIERFFRTVREQFLVEITGDTTEGRPEPAPGRRPGRAEPAVHRLGRDRLPPPRSTPRPGTPPLRAGTPAARSRCPARPRWPRRSSGRHTARSPRPRWCRCRATPTRSTRCWSGAGSSWCSTRSTSPRIAGPAPRRPGRHGDPAPHRAPRPPQGPTRDPTRRRRRRPGSTTPA